MAVVLFEDTLADIAPQYTGGRWLPLAELAAQQIPYYAVPESRGRPVDDRATDDLPVNRLLPHPYHSRTFRSQDNTEFVRELRQTRALWPPAIVCAGEPPQGSTSDTGAGSESESDSESVAGALPEESDSGGERKVSDEDSEADADWYTILDGHKRVWASAVAGLDSIPCRVVRADWETAIRLWADRHLDSPSSDAEAPESQERALARLRQDFPEWWREFADQSLFDDDGGNTRQE